MLAHAIPTPNIGRIKSQEEEIRLTEIRLMPPMMRQMAWVIFRLVAAGQKSLSQRVVGRKGHRTDNGLGQALGFVRFVLLVAS